MAIKKYKGAECGIEINAAELSKKMPLYSLSDSSKIIDFINKMPTCVYKMSEDIKDLPETSSNLGIISTNDGRVTLSTSIRSSKNTEKLALCDRITALADKYGATANKHSEYPAWEYRKDSPLRDTMVKVYERSYNKSPKVLVIHAGLECGIFSDKIEGLDSVSIGPDMFDIHTTEERLSIPSAIRVFDYLKALLKEI
jgi:dipeptidase D